MILAGNAYTADLQPLPPVVMPPAGSNPSDLSALPQTLPPTVTQGPGISTPGALFPSSVTSSAPVTTSVGPPPVVAPVATSPIGPPPALPVAPTALPTAPAPVFPQPVASSPLPPTAPIPVMPGTRLPSAAPMVAPSPPAFTAPPPPIPSSPVATFPESPLLAPSGPPPTTAVPEISQPLRPVPPETTAETAKKVEEEGIYFNVAGDDISEVVKQISRALGKNFLLDDKLKGKVTIISERKMTKDEVWEAFQSALDVLGYSIVQGPAGLLRIVANREALSNPIDLYTDKSPFTDRFLTRLITLKNISASDMANVIKGLVSKEGNLFAYPVTNTLIVTDSGTNIDRLMRLINELDQEGPQEVLEIIPIIYANAKDLAGKITQIYETTDKGTATAPPRGGKASETLEEAPKLKKVIPDDRTNSLIILASKMAIQKVRDLIRKLDSPLVGDEGEVHVYYLKYAPAKDMATVLNAISGAIAQSKDKDKKTGAPTTTAAAASAAVSPLTGGAEFSGKFTVTAEEGTNALVITAGGKDYNTLVDQVITKLDIPRRQVYVEAIIVELSVSEDQQLGLGILGGKSLNVGGNQVALFGSTFGFLDINRILSGTIGGASTGSTINIPTPGTPGSSGGTNTLSVPAFFAALQFGQGNSNVNILSTPNILTLDNQEAEIKVGEKVPFPAASATTIGGSLQTTFTREDVTLSLKIKPQISEGGNIRMEVTQEDHEVLPADQQPSTASQSGPATTERSIKTAIVATDGQTIVLGGLVKDQYTTTIQKVPGLGDIPILGYLFKTRHKTKQKVNLIVFLTPHIIREPRDFLSILQKKINEQNAFITNNFGKSQQKQIRESLATHADYLLKYGGGCPGNVPSVQCDMSGAQGYGTPSGAGATSQPEESRFPMDVTSAPSKPGKKEKKTKETQEAAPTPEPAPSATPASSTDTGEDSDLAIEGKGQRKARRKKAKAAPPSSTQNPTPAPSKASSKTPSKTASPSGNDIDLAY